MSDTPAAASGPFRSRARRPPRTARGDGWETLALLLVALALRAGYAWLAMGPHATPSSDAVTYDAVAWNLARGVGFRLGAGGGYPTAFVPPVLPFLVSLVYRALGHWFFGAILLQCVLGALVPLAVRALGGGMFGSPVARAAGWLVAVHPLLVFFCGYLLTETAFTLALVIALFATAEWIKTPRAGRALGAGLLWGAAALTRPTALPLPLVIGAWAWAPLGLSVASRERARQLALLALGVALVVGPWTARNAVQLGAFVPVTTGGGRALLDANNPLVWDDPARRGGALTVYAIEPWATRFRGRSEVEVDRMALAEARAFARTRARDWPRMALAKLARFWRPTAEAGTTGNWQRAGSPLARLMAAVDPLLAWSVVVLPLAAWGLVVTLRGARRWFQSLPALMIAAFSLGAIVYWGALRMRVPVEPCIALYAACGLEAIRTRLRVRRRGLTLVEGRGARATGEAGP